MKKIKYLVLMLFMFLPLGIVKAESNGFLPSEITANDGLITYEYQSNGYVAYLDNNVTEVTLSFPSIDGFTVFGPSSFVINSNETIIYYNLHNLEDESNIITVPVISYTELQSSTSSVNLKDLQVVGYELKFNPEVTKYEVTVPSDVEKVYVYSETTGSDVQVTGGGVVDLKSKSTNVSVTSAASGLGSKTYEIVITKKNDNVIYYVIIAGLIVLGVAIFVISKLRNRKTIKVDDIKNIDVNKTDVDSIIKPVENVKSDVSVENMISTRTMMAPEETEEVKENK